MQPSVDLDAHVLQLMTKFTEHLYGHIYSIYPYLEKKIIKTEEEKNNPNIF